MNSSVYRENEGKVKRFDIRYIIEYTLSKKKEKGNRICSKFPFFFHQFISLKKEDAFKECIKEHALKDVLRRIARFHKVCNGRKPKRITYRDYFVASPIRSIINITRAKRKRRRGGKNHG